MNIRLEQVSKRFRDTLAVDRLSAVIQEGELVCLLGPSGCGKSTTLSMVAGLEAPTEGDIYFDDQPMSQVDAEERDIGMVFQNYALYPHMTVLENIMFPLKMRRVPRADRRRRAEEMGALLQISDLLPRKPGQLSGGQQQRVAIARALVKEPQILLLDEPFSNLDARLRIELREDIRALQKQLGITTIFVTHDQEEAMSMILLLDEPFSNLDARLRIELREDIRALQKQLGITTIFVTHDQEEAMSISDRILLMRGGRLQQYSTPEEMYRRPYNRFTAGFLGNPPINFLPCRYEGGVLTVPGAPGWHLPADRLQCAQEGISGEAVLGIRPEDLSVGGGGGVLPARITALQPLGKEVYLKLAAGPHTLTASLSWDHDYQVGDELELSVKKLHLFPPESGKEASAGEAR